MIVKLFKYLMIILLFLALCYGLYFSSVKSIRPHMFDGNEMTIDYHVVVNSSEKDQNEIKKIINDTFLEIDRIYNNWNAQSEISKINRLKGYEITSLSPQLESFLHLTENLVKLSGGRFDPTIEPLQKIWKSHLEIGLIPSKEIIEEVIPAVGWKHLHFGEGKIFKDHDKTRVDFGGIAKGFCVDMIVNKIVEAGFEDVFVEWGGEIRTHGRHSAERPWKVFVGRLDDIDPQNAIAEIALENQSVATSGDYLQNWRVQENGVEIVYFHIIDPRSAKPLKSTPSSIASATVLAPTCVLADALAKAAIMHDSISEARAWADEMSRQHPNIKIWLYAREEG